MASPRWATPPSPARSSAGRAVGRVPRGCPGQGAKQPGFPSPPPPRVASGAASRALAPGDLSGPAQSDPPVRHVRGWLTASTPSPPGTRASAGASGPPMLGAAAPVEHGVPAGGRHRPMKVTHVRRNWLWGPQCSHISTAAGAKGHVKPQWSGLNPSPSQPCLGLPLLLGALKENHS